MEKNTGQKKWAGTVALYSVIDLICPWAYSKHCTLWSWGHLSEGGNL